MSKDFPELKSIDDDQIKCLHELFFRADGELTNRLRQTITESIDGLSSSKSAGYESEINMFSVEGFERTLVKLIKEKGLEPLKSETISFVVPRLFFRMLQEITKHPELNDVLKLIRECQKARFREEVIEKLTEIQKYETLDDETILNAVNTARQKLKAMAIHRYDIKLVGRDPDIKDRFDYIPPSMRRVVKKGNHVPEEFTKHTKQIDLETFHQLFLEKKKVLIIAGAGIGKTTFLLRLQLELMQKQLSETPLPVFENVSEFFSHPGTLFDRVISLLQKTRATGFSPEKTSRVAGVLNENGRLCFLLDSLDQCGEDGTCIDYFQMDSHGIFEQNRVVVASRLEHINRDPKLFCNMFSTYEWVILDGFNEDNLLNYLGKEIASNWLNYNALTKNFQELLCIPFYANITRQIGLRPESARKPVENRGRLLAEYESELFREARLRKGVKIHELDEPKIKELLYQLSLDTLTEGEIQIFPFDFISRYLNDYEKACRIIFDTHWVSFFSKTLFEGKNENLCTFYHQLLQEYFATRRLCQLFDKDQKGFDAALKKLPFSRFVLDLMNDLLDNEKIFNHCVEQINSALKQADKDKQGLKDSGHKFTWFLALRDLKGEKPELKQRLQEIFDREKEQSKKDAIKDGKFVKIPSGAFLMGGYEYGDEQPVHIVYVPEYWISIYAETFHEYDEYCKASKEEKPGDEGWGRGERPAINVSWDDVKKYMSWLREEYSLPTEAQWEKAARGSLGRKYLWGNDEQNKDTCNFRGKKTINVQKFEPQMFGIHQMAGNVWEWVEDDYHDYKEIPKDGITWIGSPRGSNRVIRGGSWFNSTRNCRSAIRSRLGPGLRSNYLGFRLSRSVTLAL